MPRADLEVSRVASVLGALASGATRWAAAAFAGISPDTFYAWLKRRPFFARAVREAEAEAEVRAAAPVVRAADRGAWRASASRAQ